MTTLFSEEPADGTILANRDLTQVYSRDDAVQPENGEWHWYPADEDSDPMHWDELKTDRWQRLYRQSDVDAAVAKVIEDIAQAIEAAAEQERADAFSPIAGATLAELVAKGADIARTWKPEG